MPTPFDADLAWSLLAALLTGAPSMHPDMFRPLLLMILGFYCLYTLVLLLRLRAEILDREQKARWVEELALGIAPSREVAA